MIGRFLNQIKVYDCGSDKVRLGGSHDGGYVVLDRLCHLAPALYSYGIGDDVGFELDFVSKYPCERVNLYDPFITAPPQDHERFMFYREGIGGDWPSPRNIPKDSFLKMDIEWSEWDALLTMPTISLIRFSQIVVEFHVLHLEEHRAMSPYFKKLYFRLADEANRELFGLYSEVSKRMNNDFWCFHAHANNSLQVVEIDGFRFPPLLEMSFVRKDLLLAEPPEFNEDLPVTGLDSPNKTDRPDINLGELMKDWRA